MINKIKMNIHLVVGKFCIVVLLLFINLQVLSQKSDNTVLIENKIVSKHLEKASQLLRESPDSSIYHAEIALSSAHQPKDIIKGNAIIGDAHQYLQNYEKAIEFYLNSIKIGEEKEIKGALANAYNGIGMTYFYLNDYSKAEQYIEKAAEEKLAINDYLYYSVIRSNLAVIYNRNEAYEKSNDILLTTKQVLIENDKEEYLSTIYQSIGANFESGFNQLDSAHYYYQKSIENAKKHQLLEVKKTGYLNLSGIAIKQKKYTEALTYVKKADDTETNTKLDQINVGILNNYSEIYDSLGNYKMAYQYKMKAYELNKELFSAEKQKAIDELEIKYQTAKKQHQIQQQEQALQKSKLETEQSKNQLYTITFSSILLILVTLGIAFYFWQKKRSNQILETEKVEVFENIVHEIRTPLTLISGPLEIVRKEMSTNKKLMGQVDLVERNTDKLIRLVNELLDASKLEKGMYIPDYQEGNLSSFIRNIIDEYKAEAEQKQIQLKTSIDDKHRPSLFPSNVIEKILNNLINNSLKYCPENSIINIRSQIKNDLLVLIVKDNGPGIPKKDHDKIFNRFYRVNEKHDQGTGIGLSLVKDLVQLLGGEIKLNSEKGKGAEFICTIPLKEVLHHQVSTEESSDLPKLLLVDDDIDILQFVSGIFEKVFEIIPAQNGANGIDLAKEHVPDIILTDIMMPVKDGLTLIQEVKKDEVTKHIPIIAFSAKGSLQSRIEGLEHGADAYIPKPFSPEELQLTLKNILKTIKQNQKDFQKSLSANKTFEERLKSKNDFVNKACQLVIENIDRSEYTITELASDLSVSRSQLHRKISSLTGFSSTNFIKMIRLEKAKDLLKHNNGNVTEIAYACGFNSQSYFTKSFKEYVGKSPSSYLNNN